MDMNDMTVGTAPWFRGSVRVERSAQPFDALAVDGYHIEAAGRNGALPRQEDLRREHETAALGGRDAGCGAAMVMRAARAHFDEHQRAIAVAHDQVDLAAARVRTARDPIIALHQTQ